MLPRRWRRRSATSRPGHVPDGPKINVGERSSGRSSHRDVGRETEGTRVSTTRSHFTFVIPWHAGQDKRSELLPDLQVNTVSGGDSSGLDNSRAETGAGKIFCNPLVRTELDRPGATENRDNRTPNSKLPTLTRTSPRVLHVRSWARP